jgi:hypothetical protein
MVDEATSRCENLACLCSVGAQTGVCSEYCGSPDGRDPQNVRCACGHPGCAEQIEQQLHGGSGRETLA